MSDLVGTNISKMMEWAQPGLLYSLSPEGELVTSWAYEYAVFELVKIHNEFDWKNNLLVFYAY